MTMVDAPVLLSGFAPLIQLWAGICLLFFYERLLNESPLGKYVNETQRVYDDFVTKYQGLIDADKIPSSYFYLGTKWEDFLPTIRCMAAMSFFYSILVLAYIGVEQNPLYSERYEAFQITNIAVILYLLLSVFATRSKVFHTYLTPVFFFIGIVAFYHVFPSFNQWCLSHGICFGESLSRSCVTLTTIITCIIGLLFVLLHLGFDYALLAKRRKTIGQIDSLFESLVGAIINQSKTKINNIPPHSRNKVLKKMAAGGVNNDGNITAEMLNQYIHEVINEELYSFITPWYKKIGEVVCDCFRKSFGSSGENTFE